MTNNTFHLILNSRGGAGEKSRNADYTYGLELLLHRMLENTLLIQEIAVERAQKETRPLAERQLLKQYTRPINIAHFHDVKELRSKIAKDMTEIKENPESKGGNPTKRLLIVLQNTDHHLDELFSIFKG